MSSGPAHNTELLPWHESQYRHLLRLEAESRLAHAYLFQGRQGLGKQMLARHLAHYLFCQATQNGQPCNRCHGCDLVRAGSHPDLRFLSPEEGKNTIVVDQVRSILEFTAKTSQQGGRKILILDPAEAMNINAANALLKALEEPPAGTLMLLISHQPALLLATIRSRCQALKFTTPEREQSQAWLESKNVGAQLSVLLDLADGAPLRALELADEDAQHERSVLHDCLQQLLKRKKGAVDAAQDCVNFAIGNNIDGMMFCLTDILRFNQSEGRIALRDPEIMPLTAYYRSAASTAALHRFRSELLAARRALVSNNNPNSRLLLESLFQGWSRAAQVSGGQP